MQAEQNLADKHGMMATFEQMVKVLGFHDMTSFLLASILVVVSIAFVAALIVSLLKKHAERKQTLLTLVNEVQAPLLEKEAVKNEPSQKDITIIEEQSLAQEIDLKKAPEKNLKARPKTDLKKTPKKVVEKKPIEPLKLTQDVPPQPLPQEEIKTPAPETTIVIETQVSAAATHVEEPVIASPAALKEKLEANALQAALKPTRGGFMEKLAQFFIKTKTISDADFVAIEEILFTADIGTKTAQKLLDTLRERVKTEKQNDKEFFFKVLKEEMMRMLNSYQQKEIDRVVTPHVIMFVGVNGAGKTTSIGKLGAKLVHDNKKVVFGAGDTFRAAAVTQLKIWGERAQALVVSGKENADPASVLFETIAQAKANHADYALCDTAGRLHTKTSLMEELEKVHRVVGKALPGAPHEVLLVIDATMGQNALVQAREFAQAAPLTGIVLSKLDGTAKGGVAVGIVDELKVPIRYVGVGEGTLDFKDFNAEQFVDALFSEV